MLKPIEVRALPNHRLYIKYSDGAEGEVNLSDLVGQGVFEAWRDHDFFNNVRIGPGRQIRWSDEIELCPDMVYMRLTGKTPEELFPQLKRELAYA
ncbi:DUF2442 domain-containing protein [candidate division KSB1 bacterium]|nr:DUF2442 domain-containing protein [candidate division KSB1 bacterium]